MQHTYQWYYKERINKCVCPNGWKYNHCSIKQTVYEISTNMRNSLLDKCRDNRAMNIYRLLIGSKTKSLLGNEQRQIEIKLTFLWLSHEIGNYDTNTQIDIMLHILVTFPRVAANGHTGRGVVGGCWPAALAEIGRWRQDSLKQDSRSRDPLHKQLNREMWQEHLKGDAASAVGKKMCNHV